MNCPNIILIAQRIMSPIRNPGYQSIPLWMLSPKLGNPIHALRQRRARHAGSIPRKSRTLVILSPTATKLDPASATKRTRQSAYNKRRTSKRTFPQNVSTSRLTDSSKTLQISIKRERQQRITTKSAVKLLARAVKTTRARNRPSTWAATSPQF